MQGTEIHLQSLSLSMVVVSGVTFLCLAPAIFRFPGEFRAGLRAWLVGTALVTLTDVLFFLDLRVSFLGAILVALSGLGIAEWIHALRLFDRQIGRAVWPYVIVAAGTAVCAVSPAYPTIVLATSVVFGVLYLGAARVGARIRLEGPSVGRSVLVTVFATIAAVMLARVVMFFTLSDSGASPGFTSLPRAMMFIVASAGPFAGSLGFVLMCGEKLGHQLVHLSLTDPLTGIANRRAFLESLDRALSFGHRHNEPVAVLIVDIDHFKRINDESGHLAGDQALTEVAALLASAVRSEDMVGRLGGEEFGIFQSDAGLEAAAAVAERVRKTVAEHTIVVAGREYNLTVSIGVTVSSGQEQKPSELLSQADRHLYAAKGRGRNQVATDAA